MLKIVYLCGLWCNIVLKATFRFGLLGILTGFNGSLIHYFSLY